MKNSKKLCHYIDMPIQHISDEVLSSMKRGHTGKIVKDIITDFRQSIPDIAFRTTLITGYPNETEQDYNKLREFVEAYKIDRLGVFPFSPEQGTQAAELDDWVPSSVKSSRADEIMELQSRISHQLNKKKTGTIYKALVDRKEGDYWVMRSQYDSPEVDTEIYVTGNTHTIREGNFFHVKITAADEYDLYAEVVEAL